MWYVIVMYLFISIYLKVSGKNVCYVKWVNCLYVELSN